MTIHQSSVCLAFDGECTHITTTGEVTAQVDFLYNHTALERGIVEREIDRYIAELGQTTSYMIGRLEIGRLRAKAAAALDHRFSIPHFHDTILQGGMTPLDQLARRIDTWIVATANDEHGGHL